MPILTLPKSGLSLQSTDSSAKPDASSTSILALTLSDSVIEDMIKSVRMKQGIQLSLGSDPKIIYGAKAQHFSTIPDPFTHELYRSTVSHSKDSSNEMPPLMQSGFFANMRFKPGRLETNYTAKPVAPKANATAKAATAGTDAALAALQGTLATAAAKKSANTTKLVKDASSLPPAVQKKGSAQPIKTRFLGSKGSLGGARSMPSSPGLSGIDSPSLAPTSVPLSQQQAEKTKAIRSPLIHQLALGPATESDLMGYKSSEWTDAEYKLNMEKVADPEGSKWVLKQKSYKELDVWKYKYDSQDDRQIAIDNAVRAYDKMRTDLSAPEWERLLPKDERGTGKCLSKLQAKIASGTAKPPKAPREDGEAEDSELFGEPSSKAQSMARSSSQSSVTKSKKPTEKEAIAKRLLGKPGKPKPAPQKAERKAPAEKESAKIKSSKFVSDSDDEDDFSLTAPVTTIAKKEPPPPKPAAKRFREDTDISGADSPAVKKPKKEAPKIKSSTTTTTAQKHRISDASHTSRSTTNSHATNNSQTSQKSKSTTSTSPPKSSPLASSPPTNAHDLEDNPYESSSASPYASSVPLVKRKAESELSGRDAKRAYSQQQNKLSTHKPSSSVSSNSSSGYGGRTPSQEVMQMAAKFKLYYQKYTTLWHDLNSVDGAKRKDRDMEQLMEMHTRLERMKAEIAAGYGA